MGKVLSVEFLTPTVIVTPFDNGSRQVESSKEPGFVLRQGEVRSSNDKPRVSERFFYGGQHLAVPQRKPRVGWRRCLNLIQIGTFNKTGTTMKNQLTQATPPIREGTIAPTNC